MAGRGRLGSIDLLPEEAEEDVVWVCQQLAERKLTQKEILAEFNGRLAAKGIEGISPSAFNRRAVFLARNHRRVQNMQQAFKGLSAQFEAKEVDESNIILGEFLKMLIFELLEETGGDRTPKQAMELARAFASTVSAQKVSSERRQALKAEFEAKTTKAIETVAKKQGLSRETVDRLRAEFLGIEAPAKGKAE